MRIGGSRCAYCGSTAFAHKTDRTAPGVVCYRCGKDHDLTENEKKIVVTETLKTVDRILRKQLKRRIGK